MINIAFIINGDTSTTSVKTSYNVSRTVKVYALFVLILQLAFLATIGPTEKA
jgi:hypothetical protein